ncbi:MFS transporter [Agrococcus sp. ARC_14]|uniref:MFS transporter n=1 Tax=Agrococcus sp. ARC_14 TaxID=2919927 RepID=UPI001F05232A|nr:MFS transporter [Agrococcus sp. ARC_14]MCH1883975.1 MFS transporter [Agrococcus sp. ARC_14]
MTADVLAGPSGHDQVKNGPVKNGPVRYEKASKEERRSVTGASVGFFIDMFDIYLPVIALAPAMVFFMPADMDAGTRAILAGLIFASTLIARPIGSIIFGWLGDSIGRKKATVIAVAGAGVGTGLIALLPGYEQVGLLGVVLLIVLRFIDGIFLGGEYTGAVPLAMEHSNPNHRGRNAGLNAFGFPASYVAISALTLVVLQFAPAGDPSSAYSQWGWRIAFVVGAVISIAFAIYYSRTVEESAEWQKTAALAKADTTKKRPNPLKELLTGAHRTPLLQAFLLMTGVWFSSNAAIVILPPTISGTTGLTPTETSIAMILAFLTVCVAYPLFGMLSQRIGRRAFFVWCGIASFLTIPLYVLFASGVVTSFWAVTGVVALIALLGVPAFGAIGAYMSERFPVSIRATGYGVGYSLALIIPSFYAFYTTGLSAFMPMELAPTVLLVVGGICLIVGALWGPETKGVDLGAAADDVVGKAAQPART